MDAREILAADELPVLPFIYEMWIALIEDNDNLRQSLVDYLRGEGANVLASKDAASIVPCW